MKKLKVNHKNYALFNYTPYLDRRDNEISRPTNLTYDLGDVVYIKNENTIGVVLGCIDEQGQEVRTDMDGMQWFGNLEPATMEHFNIPEVRFKPTLKTDLEGNLKRKYDDAFLDGLTKKYEKNNDEIKRGFLFDAQTEFCIIKNKVVYLTEESGKEIERVGDFSKQSIAIEFAKELDLVILDKPLFF